MKQKPESMKVSGELLEKIFPNKPHNLTTLILIFDIRKKTWINLAFGIEIKEKHLPLLEQSKEN